MGTATFTAGKRYNKASGRVSGYELLADGENVGSIFQYCTPGMIAATYWVGVIRRPDATFQAASRKELLARMTEWARKNDWRVCVGDCASLTQGDGVSYMCAECKERYAAKRAASVDTWVSNVSGCRYTSWVGGVFAVHHDYPYGESLFFGNEEIARGTAFAPLALPEFAGESETHTCRECGAVVGNIYDGLDDGAHYLIDGYGDLEGHYCARCWTVAIVGPQAVADFYAMSAGDMPDAERDAVWYMAAEYDAAARMAFDEVCRLGDVAQEIKHGERANNSDTRLTLADDMYGAADLLGNLSRWQNQCLIRFGDLADERDAAVYDAVAREQDAALAKALNTPGAVVFVGDDYEAEMPEYDEPAIYAEAYGEIWAAQYDDDPSPYAGDYSEC